MKKLTNINQCLTDIFKIWLTLTDIFSNTENQF